MDQPTRGITKVDRPTIRELRVEVESGPDRGKVVSTSRERLSIGSAPSNDLALSDDTVSRFHAELVRRTDSILIVDHGSTNGTFVGETKLVRGFVQPGVALRIGKSSIRISDGEPVEVDIFEGDGLGMLLGRSMAMRKVISQVKMAASSDVSVLILGETGTGKELVARALAEQGPRAGQAFEPVDCGAILPTLIASELFGHEKGAFTGADQRYLGAFERANGGTLFLDEIGELPLPLQTALLGALERRQFRRVGGTDRIDVDIRLVSATNRDLRSEVNTGRFRPDVYYRVAVVTIELPPLRERPEDIPLLTEHFLRQAGFDGPLESVFPPRALARMKEAHWPGNVRELKNLVEAALVMGGPPDESLVRELQRTPGSLPTMEELVELGFNDARNAITDAFEVAYVEHILKNARGNASLAARSARMHRSYLNRLLTRHGIRVARGKQEDD